jgi:hypothetical protein
VGTGDALADGIEAHDRIGRERDVTCGHVCPRRAIDRVPGTSSVFGLSSRMAIISASWSSRPTI